MPIRSSHRAAFWTGWSQVPGGGATPDAPGATTYQGRLYVFVRGTDNRIYLNRLTGSSAWTGWSEVPGGGFTPSGPAATSYAGQLYLFVRGLDSKIYLNRLTGLGSWTGWGEVPGAGLDPFRTGCSGLWRAPATVRTSGTDSAIYYNSLLFTTWTGWSQVPGGGVTLVGPSAAPYRGTPLRSGARD